MLGKGGEVFSLIASGASVGPSDGGLKLDFFPS